MSSRLIQLSLILAINGFVCAATPRQSTPTPRQDDEAVPIINEVEIADCASFWADEMIINDEATFKRLIAENKSGRCAQYKDVQIDFARYTMLGVNVFADCHAKLAVQVIKNDHERWYEVKVDEKYGGCRGMRLFNRYILVAKIPQNYAVRFKLNRDRGPAAIAPGGAGADDRAQWSLGNQIQEAAR